MNVYEKMLKVMEDVDYLKKDGKIDYGKTKYSYLSEEKITNNIRSSMIKHGLVLFPVAMESTREDFVTIDKNGNEKRQNYALVEAKYRIVEVSTGESIEVCAVGHGLDAGDKAVYKAITGAFKYMQRETFMIPSGDSDPDKTPSEKQNPGTQFNPGKAAEEYKPPKKDTGSPAEPDGDKKYLEDRVADVKQIMKKYKEVAIDQDKKALDIIREINEAAFKSKKIIDLGEVGMNQFVAEMEAVITIRSAEGKTEEEPEEAKGEGFFS